MKTAFLLRVLTVVLVALGAGQSCSSKDDKAQEEAVAPDTEENAAEGEAAEGEAAEGEAAADGEEAETETAEADSEAAAAAEVMADSNAAPEDNVVADPMGVNETTTQVMEPMITDESDAAATAAPEANSAPATAEVGGAGPAIMAEPMSGGSVKYVKSKSVKVYSQADASSSVVRTLWKGDHMLVTVEGSWARLSSGGYVELGGLSDRGVGRPRSSGSWR
jgi:hypothetical protein